MNNLYGTPVSGMKGADFELNVAANNIANLNTSGYEAVEPIVTDLPEQAQLGQENFLSPDAPATHIGMGVQPSATPRDTRQALLEATGNPLDVAINGPGYIAVRQQNGQLAYTRQLSLHVQPDGQLVTRDGLSLVPPVRVPANVLSVTIARDGRVSAQTGPSTVAPLGKLTVVSFAAPENLREQSGLYTETLGSGRPRTGITGAGGATGAGAIQVMASYQLRSTVDLATEMSNMIEAQRMYEANSKALQTLDALVNTTVTLGAH
jgi:flagellar basal-body rod protein FlgG